MSWVVWESDEICRALPGGNMSIKDIFASPEFKALKFFFNIFSKVKTENGSTAENKEKATKNENLASKAMDKLPEVMGKGEGIEEETD
jgi:hypothetical protein